MRALGSLAVLLSACLWEPYDVRLDRVQPQQVGTVFGSRLTLQGAFEPRVTLDFDRPEGSAIDASFSVLLRGPSTLRLTTVSRLSASVLQGSVPPAAPAGRYALEVTGPTGATAQLDDALEVVSCAQACVPGCGCAIDAGP